MLDTLLTTKYQEFKNLFDKEKGLVFSRKIDLMIV